MCDVSTEAEKADSASKWRQKVDDFIGSVRKMDHIVNGTKEKMAKDGHDSKPNGSSSAADQKKEK